MAWVLIGAALVACGTLILVALWRTGEHRVATGARVRATVDEVQQVFIAPGVYVSRMAVEYDSGGRHEKVGMMNLLGGYQGGKSVTVYVDGSDPSKAATANGFLTEGWLTLISRLLPVAGLAIGAQHIGTLVRDVRRASHGANWVRLRKPRPSASKYADTVLTVRVGCIAALVAGVAIYLLGYEFWGRIASFVVLPASGISILFLAFAVKERGYLMEGAKAEEISVLRLLVRLLIDVAKFNRWLTFEQRLRTARTESRPS